MELTASANSCSPIHPIARLQLIKRIADLGENRADLPADRRDRRDDRDRNQRRY
jgi:hypothetical protein